MEDKLQKYRELMEILNKQKEPVYESELPRTDMNQEIPEMNMTPMDGSYLSPEDTAREPVEEYGNPSQEVLDMAAGMDRAKEEFKAAGEGKIPFPGIGLGINTDAMNVQDDSEVKDLIASQPKQDTRYLAGESPVELPSVSKEEESPATKSPKTKEEDLMEKYLAAKEEYDKGVTEGYAKDRRSQLIQGLVADLGKALTYSGYAGGNVMSGPIPIDIKPIDMKYAEEAKEKGKNKLDTYKELISHLKTVQKEGYKTFTEKFDGKVNLITTDAKGNVVNSKELGKVKDDVLTVNGEILERQPDGSIKSLYKSTTKDQDKNDRKESHLYDQWMKNDVTKNTNEVATGYEKVLAASQDPSAAGDISLIFGYMKMLDPASTVREGEFATAEKAAGVPERIRNTYNKIMKGKRLTDSQRSDFSNQAKKVLEAQMKRQKSFDNTVRARAEKSGLDPDNVVLSDTLFGNISESKVEKKIKVIDPDGLPRMIPKSQVNKAIQAGGKLAE